MNHPLISFEDYSAIVCAATIPPKYLRAGQAAMNELYKRNTKMYACIIEENLDPFYDDSKVAAFLEYLDSRIA